MAAAEQAGGPTRISSGGPIAGFTDFEGCQVQPLAEETLALIDEHAVTHHYAVPTHFSRMLKLSQEAKDGFSGARLRYVVHTAAPCPPAVKQQMIDWWGPVIFE